MKIIPITDLHIPELEIYNERREVQLLRYYEPAPGLFIAESANVILRALATGYEPLSILMEQREADSEKGREVLGRIMEISEEIPAYVSSNEVLSQISGFKLARGMLCAMRRRALPKMEELCRCAGRIAILENVVNPTNVGAIFRCAAALGIDAVLLPQAAATRCTVVRRESAWGRYSRYPGHFWGRKTGRIALWNSCVAWDTVPQPWR